MNVIITNNYKEQLASLNIEVIKRLEGVYSADEIIDTFQNFFFNKLILDLTALDNYNDLKNLQKLSIALDMSKIILLLPQNSGFTIPSNLSKLIAMGIYNFTASVEGITYLYNNPNSYRDVAQYHQLEGDISNVVSPAASGGMTLQMGQKIIGVKNLTAHAGATSLIYMMYKHLQSNYNVVCVEVDKRDFVYFGDKNMRSIGSNDINKFIADNSDKEIILVDINNSSLAENVCGQVLLLLEPSILKLNKLLSVKPKITEEIRGKLVVLNQCPLEQKDINTFEYETKIKPFYCLPYIDDHGKSQVMFDFLRSIGFDRI